MEKEEQFKKSNTGDKINTISLLTGWQIIGRNNKFYISYTHYVYLEFISKKFAHIYLIAPVNLEYNGQLEDFKEINFNNLSVIRLPFYNSYKSAIPFAWKFYKKIKSISDKTDLFYCRVPDPFSWMPALVFRKETIMHYVGDAIRVILTNREFSSLKKIFYLSLFSPEFLLTLIASRFSTVYTNGFEIAGKLKKIGIKAVPVISSTLKPNDFYVKEFDVKLPKISLLYVGYLRHSKGVETIIKAAKILKDKSYDIFLNIVGDGEAKNYLNLLISELRLVENVKLWGHIDDRDELNKFYRNNDIFVFPSLSEGSPRAVLEAMANSLPVISTKVGALPKIFTENKEIIFSRMNDPGDFAKKIEILVNDFRKTNSLIKNSYRKVFENFTIDKFLGVVFSNET